MLRQLHLPEGRSEVSPEEAVDVMDVLCWLEWLLWLVWLEWLAWFEWLDTGPVEAAWLWWWAEGRALFSPTPALGAWGVGSARWCMVITLLAATDVSVAQLATSSSRHKCSFNVSIYTSGWYQPPQTVNSSSKNSHSNMMGCERSTHFTPSVSCCVVLNLLRSLRRTRYRTISLDGHTPLVYCRLLCLIQSILPQDGH